MKKRIEILGVVNGARGEIKKIIRDRIKTARGRILLSKPYAVIAWESTSKGQQKFTTAYIEYLYWLEKKGGIIITVT